jgi:hypothetical protein
VEPASNRRWAIAAGAGAALAGHALASGPWLYTLVMSAVYGAPDTVFLVVCVSAVLHLALFGCVPVGLSLHRGRHRNFGFGLLAGWGAGIVVLVVGTVALLLVPTGR